MNPNSYHGPQQWGQDSQGQSYEQQQPEQQQTHGQQVYPQQDYSPQGYPQQVYQQQSYQQQPYQQQSYQQPYQSQQSYPQGQPPAQAQGVGRGGQSGLKPFVPPPLTNRRIHNEVRGTGYVGLLGFMAWLTAVIGSVAAVVRTVNGLAALIQGLVEGTTAEINNFVENPELPDLIGLVENPELPDNIFSGAGSVWDLLVAIPGGIIGLFFGFITLLLTLIPFAFMAAALRTNYKVGRVLIIVNMVMCSLGGWFCYLAVKNAEAVVVLPVPYAGVSLVALIILSASVILWLVAVVIYFLLIAKSNRRNRQY